MSHAGVSEGGRGGREGWEGGGEEGGRGRRGRRGGGMGGREEMGRRFFLRSKDWDISPMCVREANARLCYAVFA